MRWNLVPMTYKQLEDAAYPLVAGIPETLPWWWFDTQTYPAAGINELVYFVTPPAAGDVTLSNWVQAGTLPDPMFFAIYGIQADIFSAAAPFATTAAGGPTGAIDDMGLIDFVARGVLTVRLSQKDYGPWPLTAFHGTGGPVGFGWGTFTAEESIQYANHGIFDGGGWIGGSIIIPPKTDFSIRIRFQPTLIPVTVAKNIRVTMTGTLYRAVK